MDKKWLQTLAFSGLFSGAAKMVESAANIGHQPGIATVGLGAAVTAAAVVGGYLTNRASSQREIQLNDAERQALSERNHHLRSGMANALRRALTAIAALRREGDAYFAHLPADPYDGLIADWDRQLGRAVTDPATLDRLFPAEFAESQWQSTNAYSPNVPGDSEALASLMREWLNVDLGRYQRWDKEAALEFASRLLPYYQQAFAADLAGDSQGLLYRAFTIKGINQIRFFSEQALIELRKFAAENESLHRVTHGMQTEANAMLSRIEAAIIRPRNEPAADSTAAGGRKHDAPASPIGPAQPFFMQEGLLNLLIGAAATIDNRVLVPNLDIETTNRVETLVQFVETDQLASISGRINASAFSRQPWYGTSRAEQAVTVRKMNILEKTKRNTSHYRKNPRTLLLVRAFPIRTVTPAGEYVFTPQPCYIGFSHVIPLTGDGYDRYRRGEITDNALPSSVICGPGEKASALLLFSIAVDTARSLHLAYKGLRRDLYFSGEWGYQLGLLLVQVLSYHVQRIMREHDGGEPIPLLAQNDNALVQALRMAGFVETPDVSGDGLKIWAVTGMRVPAQ